MQDFRNQDPVWVWYAEYIGNGSDKYYEVRIDMGDDGLFYLTKRWGARPDVGKGQIKVESSQNLPYAQTRANLQVNAKIKKGYVICERPTAANRQVSQDWSDQ